MLTDPANCRAAYSAAMLLPLALALAAPQPDAVTDPFLRSRITVEIAPGETFTLPYCLHRPQGRSGPQPLLLFLHGAGERGDDNDKQLIHLPAKLVGKNPPAAFAGYILAPQCPNGHKWVEVPWGDKRSVPMPEQPSLPMRALLALLDELLAKEPIDRDRVLLTGLSMGGYGTWDLLARRPDLFAAALPLCGGGDEQTARRIASVPTWVWHGARDQAVPVERSRSMVDALRAVGAGVRYSELAEVEHRVWDQAYAKDGALAWLFAQRKGAAPTRPAGDAFTLGAGARVCAPAAELRPAAEHLARLLRDRSGFPVPVVESAPEVGDVVVRLGAPQTAQHEGHLVLRAPSAAELLEAAARLGAGWPRDVDGELRFDPRR